MSRDWKKRLKRKRRKARLKRKSVKPAKAAA